MYDCTLIAGDMGTGAQICLSRSAAANRLTRRTFRAPSFPIYAAGQGRGHTNRPAKRPPNVTIGSRSLDNDQNSKPNLRKTRSLFTFRGVWLAYRSGFSVSSAPRAASIEEREGALMSQPEPDGRTKASDILEVEARTHRRTASVELRGELDIASVSEVAEVVDGLAPDADGPASCRPGPARADIHGRQGSPRADPPERLCAPEPAQPRRRTRAQGHPATVGVDRRRGDPRHGGRPRGPGAAAIRARELEHGA